MAPSTLELVLPSTQSPIKPTAEFQLPLPSDYEYLLNSGISLDRAAAAPTLRWQICPAFDRIAATSSKRCVLEAYRRLCDASALSAGKSKEQMVIDIFRDICRVELTLENAKLIVSGYQLDPANPSTAEQLILDLKGGLSPLRLGLVRDVYNLITRTASQPSHFKQTAKALFKPLGHPRVRSGEIGADRLHTQFCTYWNGREGGKEGEEGVVELIEWEYYYAGVGASIEGDDFFEKMILGCWPDVINETGDLEDTKKTGTGGREPSKPQLGLAEYQMKKKVATNIRKLDMLVSESRTFRTALDLCIMRNPPPPAPPAQQPLFSRPYLRFLISEMYELVGCGLTSNDDDEQLLESIYRRVLKESGNGRGGGILELEWALRSALRRECNFMEYKIVARVAES
ncbi:hypothetical protein DFJ77DRAFT_362693 [Powellomyces hirtus]|nr:hypothetical protein DFJ77DRAFT_362693 [Powellomyces hirtus]